MIILLVILKPVKTYNLRKQGDCHFDQMIKFFTISSIFKNGMIEAVEKIRIKNNGPITF